MTDIPQDVHTLESIILDLRQAYRTNPAAVRKEWGKISSAGIMLSDLVEMMHLDAVQPRLVAAE